MASTTLSLSYYDYNHQATPNSSVNDTSFSTECLQLQFEDFVPWNNPDNIVSFQTEKLVRNLKNLFFLPIMFVIGCPANLINMAVFYKQGLKERINVCLFALSLADELHLLNNMMFFGEQLLVIFTTGEEYGPFKRLLANNNLIGLFGFIWISQIMSAIIALDRCICIMQPLRSQTIISTCTMTTIIVTVSLIILALFFFIASRYWIVCAYDPFTDRTLMTHIPGEFYLRHQMLIDYLDGLFFGAILPMSVMVTVTTTTIITAIKLRQAAAWRADTSSSSGLSQSEISLTKMLVANSIFFIACVFPSILFRFFSLFLPEINTGRRKHNFYIMFHWIMISISYINSTFNIVVYYVMGTRFRQTFWQIFGKSHKTINRHL